MFPDMTEHRLLCSPACGREWAVAPILLGVLGLLYELFCFTLPELPLSTEIPRYLLSNEVTHGLHLPRWASEYDNAVEIL